MGAINQRLVSLIAICILSFLIRVIAILTLIQDPTMGMDPQYWNGALNLKEAQVYSEMRPPSTHPTANVPPGYSLWIALLGGSKSLVIIAQILLSVATAGLVYAIVEKGSNRKNATVAGVIYAMAPYSAYMAGRITSETLFTFLFVSALYCLSRQESTKNTFRDSFWSRYRYLMGAGASLGIACLVRPIGLGLLGIAIIYMAITIVRKYSLKSYTTFVLIALLPISLWGIRNEVLFGDPLWGGVNADIVLAHHIAAWTLSRAENISVDEARAAIGTIDELAPRAEELHELRRRAWHVLRRYPREWLKGYMQGIPILLLGMEPYGPDLFPRPEETISRGIRDLLTQGEIRLALRQFLKLRWDKYRNKAKVFYSYSILYNLATIVLSIWGLRKCLRAFGSLGVLGILWGFWLILAPCPQTSARFRMPVEPLLAIAASAVFYRYDEFEKKISL
jgi:4-amino-4-deoxy-L-arabinose transferase-like glycosyltransferase